MTENKVETNNTTQAIKKPQTSQNSSNSISNCQLSNSSSTTAEVNHQVLQRLLLIVHQTQIVVQVLRLRAVGQTRTTQIIKQNLKHQPLHQSQNLNQLKLQV